MKNNPTNRGRTEVLRVIANIAVRFRFSVFIILLFLSAAAVADANNGEYLGFKLGEKFSVPRGAVAYDHITGALFYVVNPGQRHQHISSLSIYVSPKSSIIGSIFGEWYFSNARSAKDFSGRYLQTLEKEYSHWKRRGNSLTNGDYQLWVDLEQKPPIVDHWPSDKNFRVAIALIFAPDSTRRNEWMATIHREVNNLEVGNY